MRMFDYLKPLGVKVGLIKDYVTEYKTIDGWECETWASGKKIARATLPEIWTGTLSATGTWYYKNGIEVKELPANFFKEVKYKDGQYTIAGATNVYFDIKNNWLVVNVGRSMSASFSLKGNCVLEGV